MWIDLKPAGETAFTLDITPPISVGPADRLFMFGGVGLGASLRALEQVTGRPVVSGPRPSMKAMPAPAKR